MMSEIKASSPKKGLKILIVVAILSIVLFVVVFCLLAYLKRENTMYSQFNQAIADPYVETYIESESNLNPIKAAYENTLNDFTSTSKALQLRLSYYLPYLVHLKFDVPTTQQAKKLLKSFNEYKKSFEEILNETKIDCLKGSNKKPSLYYGAFLPRYQQYINAKFEVVKFIESFFEKVNFVISPYLTNLNKLTNVYLELSINIALPSVYASSSNANTLSAFISQSNQISLEYLNNKFIDFKNTFKNNVDSTLTHNYVTKFNELETTFNVLLNVYKNLNDEQKHAFLLAPKVKPSNIDLSKDDYSLDYLLSYFAINNGRFLKDTTSSSILNYFNF